jgi:amino acid adenylation domain-containing protein
MRAGAAYVPLDITWPDLRLRSAIADSGATVIVAPTGLLDRLQLNLRSVDPRTDTPGTAELPTRIPVSLHPEDLAYIIYTSGSSGTPKGVEITHGNLANLVHWYRDAFQVTEQDRASHLLGLAFDATVLEMWGHLTAGATLCSVEDSVRTSPELIQHWISDKQITISLVPTAIGAFLISMKWPATTDLRLLVIGGDRLHQGPKTDMPFQVVNQYGPTECTVVSTWSTVTAETDKAPAIGIPITGATLYLLDENQRPVEDGAIGEIYISGELVGRGYRNAPELTERNFLPAPFSTASDTRMYRTGDRGLKRPTGEFEFCGRLDRQAKVRGYRVELDEVENNLSRHPSLVFAIVIAKANDILGDTLVAYVLPHENEIIPTRQELIEHLKQYVPDYMIPASFYELNSLPLSANGKIDIAQLELNSDLPVLPDTVTTEAASAIENKLLTQVRELLRQQDLRANANFFLAGGHSLLGMQLVMRIRGLFGVELTLQELFDAPTVSSLALLIEDKLVESINSMSDREVESYFAEQH